MTNLALLFYKSRQLPAGHYDDEFESDDGLLDVDRSPSKTSRKSFAFGSFLSSARKEKRTATSDHQQRGTSATELIANHDTAEALLNNFLNYYFDRLPSEVVGFKMNNRVVTRADVARICGTLLIGAVYIFTPPFIDALMNKRGNDSDNYNDA